MKNSNQNQHSERRSNEDHPGARQDFFYEIIRLFHQLHKADTLSQEKFKEKIQEFKAKLLNRNFENGQNLFAAQNKDYLINLIKNIG